MLDTYFFIPGDKQKYLDKINVLNTDYIVIDLEDAVAQHSKQEAYDLVMSMPTKENYFIRIPFFENVYSDIQIKTLIEHFNGRIALPKIENNSQIRHIKDKAPGQDLNMIVLIENPRCLINLNTILDEFAAEIHGIGFGSHDFCSITGIKHELEHILNYKRQIVLYAKAYEVKYIDGVDLDLNDFTQLKKECLFAFEMGANGKFLIHPRQIEQLHSVQYLTKGELEEITEVYEFVKDIPEDDIEVYTINGKVYEKPHIKRIKGLIHKLNN